MYFSQPDFDEEKEKLIPRSPRADVMIVAEDTPSQGSVPVDIPFVTWVRLLGLFAVAITCGGILPGQVCILDVFQRKLSQT